MKYLSGISSLKAVAAISVICYHLNQIRPNSLLTQKEWDFYLFIETWTIAVSFFFIISGMFLANQYIQARDADENTISPLRDTKMRLFRLVPVFLIVFTLSIIVDTILHGAPSLSISKIIGGIFLLGPWCPESFFPSITNGPLWYIAFDIWCFFFSSILLWMGLQASKLATKLVGKTNFKASIQFTAFWSIVGIGAGILGYLHLTEFGLGEKPAEGILSEWYGQYTIWIFTLHYLSGVLIMECIYQVNKFQKYFRFLSDILFLCFCYGLYLFLWEAREIGDFEKSLPHGPFHFPFSTLYIAGIIICTPFLVIFKPILENPVTRWISRISYSTYLIHGIWIGILLKIFAQATAELTVWYYLAVGTFILTGLSGWFMNAKLESINWQKIVSNWVQLLLDKSSSK